MVKKDNYYDILEIEKTATADEIKKAYRKQAFKWHPDKNLENKEEADQMFKKISEAYQHLSDPEKRRMYDIVQEAEEMDADDDEDWEKTWQERCRERGGPKAKDPFDFKYRDKPFAHHSSPPGPQRSSPEDMFNAFFQHQMPAFSDHNGQNPFANPFFTNGLRQATASAAAAAAGGSTSSSPMRKSEPIQFKLPLTYRDIYKGVKRRITFRVSTLCDTCGSDCIQTCDMCQGTGSTTIHRQMGFAIQQTRRECGKCSGGGRIRVQRPCDKCGSKGEKMVEKSVILEVGRGTNFGEKQVFEGGGHQRIGEERGDIFIEVVEDERNKTGPYQKDGFTLIYHHEVLLGDALTGCRIEIDHLKGEKIYYQEKSILRDGMSRTIRGYGFPKKDGSFGDLRVIYKIIFPMRKFTAEQARILRSILPCSEVEEGEDEEEEEATEVRFD